MKAGHESRTAVLVCMGRAAAHGATAVAGFADPTALALLPDDARARVERFRSGIAPKGIRARLADAYLYQQSKVMVARTVAIDEAVRAVASPQLVILGAGLDGRAWRMPELRDAIVFEVDHPDSQRDKRARAAALAPAFARDLRFVPVDFARDDLGQALAAAGHDPARPTTWIWEGVIMYLAPADVDATLAVIARRSATGSRLILVYHSPALMLRIVGLYTRALGEPFRSAFTPETMRALLGKFGFRTARDEDLPTAAAALCIELGRKTRFMTHMRIAIADRVAEADRSGA